MLIVSFQGWFQVRLATDPDPADEPRGISGTTFAVAGEPDFDRVVRFHDPVSPRSFGQPVGVFVHEVHLGGQPRADHPLIGARVELLDGPIFMNHNNVVTISETEPFDPFHLKLSRGALSLQRNDYWDPARPELTAFEAPPELMQRRLGVLSKDSVKVGLTTGITDYAAYRLERRRNLEEELARASDEVVRLALRKRIKELSREDDAFPRERLGYCMTYRFALNGRALVEDPDAQLGGAPDLACDWPLELWMGAYDSDTLCGFTTGILEVPFR